jgi:hypothetical protein
MPATIPKVRLINSGQVLITNPGVIGRINRILALAYKIRPCFHCGLNSTCEHREPEIELLLAARRGIGAQTWAL